MFGPQEINVDAMYSERTLTRKNQLYTQSGKIRRKRRFVLNLPKKHRGG